jgi:hypothetical protein
MHGHMNVKYFSCILLIMYHTKDVLNKFFLYLNDHVPVWTALRKWIISEELYKKNKNEFQVIASC